LGLNVVMIDSRWTMNAASGDAYLCSETDKEQGGSQEADGGGGAERGRGGEGGDGEVPAPKSAPTATGVHQKAARHPRDEEGQGLAGTPQILTPTPNATP
jgi:hypothetical protein